jgi:hypothetical protein
MESIYLTREGQFARSTLIVRAFSASSGHVPLDLLLATNVSVYAAASGFRSHSPFMLNAIFRFILS